MKMKKKQRTRRSPFKPTGSMVKGGGPQSGRASFTLVEMLVVMALTLIMMVVFAQVFGNSADFVRRQKGIAENDQAARILTTALYNDLQARTMRIVAPF